MSLPQHLDTLIYLYWRMQVTIRVCWVGGQLGCGKSGVGVGGCVCRGGGVVIGLERSGRGVGWGLGRITTR